MQTVQLSVREDLYRRIRELSDDDFYNDYNQSLLLRAIKDMKAGKGTYHELIEVESEE